jgi:ferric-dicitrate binding protein FerR (iron transport regulator)
MPLQYAPIPPYLTMVNNWLQKELTDARKAQAVNQSTLDACLALLDKARNARNATAIAAAQRAVTTAEEGLRKNRLREQRALKAISWVERLREERNSSTRVAGFMPRVEGTVEIQSAGGGAARPVTGDTPPVLGPGDTLRTGKDGHADVLLNEGGILSLDSGSALILSEAGAAALVKGEIRCWMRRKFEVRTPSCAVAVRGTEFVVREIPGKPASVVVIDGTVAFSDIKGAKTVLVGAGQQSYLLPDGMPAEPTKANLQEMKKWWEE